MDDTLVAFVTADLSRYLVRLKEPEGERRNPVEFYRWTLRDARKAADRLVQAYYPHDCADCSCGEWEEL